MLKQRRLARGRHRRGRDAAPWPAPWRLPPSMLDPARICRKRPRRFQGCCRPEARASALFDDDHGSERSSRLGIAFASAAEIDRTLNIRQATHLAAMRRALAGLPVITASLRDDRWQRSCRRACVCGGDTIIAGRCYAPSSIAAASIVAKVTRDRLMHRLCRQSPRLRVQQPCRLRHADQHLAAHRRVHGPLPVSSDELRAVARRRRPRACGLTRSIAKDR